MQLSCSEDYRLSCKTRTFNNELLCFILFSFQCMLVKLRRLQVRYFDVETSWTVGTVDLEGAQHYYESILMKRIVLYGMNRNAWGSIPAASLCIMSFSFDLWLCERVIPWLSSFRSFADITESHRRIHCWDCLVQFSSHLCDSHFTINL